MVGFQHDGVHVQFSLKVELQSKILAAVKDIETALDMPEDIAALCWQCRADDECGITEEEFEEAIVAAPERGGVMLVGLMENVKGDDSIKELLNAATRKIDAFRNESK